MSPVQHKGGPVWSFNLTRVSWESQMCITMLHLQHVFFFFSMHTSHRHDLPTRPMQLIWGNAQTAV